MNANFYLLFFVRNNRIKNGEIPLYLRITLDGKRAEASVGRKLKLSLWNASVGKANGNTGDAQVLNRYLNKVENDVYKSYQTLLDQNIPFGQTEYNPRNGFLNYKII